RTGGILCNSAYTEHLARMRTRRIWRVPNAVRKEFFSSTASIQKPCRCILLNIGVISPRKRQLELLEMFERMQEQGVKFEVHFVGPVPRKDSYTTAFLDKI